MNLSLSCSQFSNTHKMKSTPRRWVFRRPCTPNKETLLLGKLKFNPRKSRLFSPALLNYKTWVTRSKLLPQTWARSSRTVIETCLTSSELMLIRDWRKRLLPTTSTFSINSWKATSRLLFKPSKPKLPLSQNLPVEIRSQLQPSTTAKLKSEEELSRQMKEAKSEHWLPNQQRERELFWP